MDTIQTITALGGPTKIASALSIKPEAVSNWKRRGLPNSIKTRVALLNLARSQGVEVDESALMGIDMDVRSKRGQ